MDKKRWSWRVKGIITGTLLVVVLGGALACYAWKGEREKTGAKQVSSNVTTTQQETTQELTGRKIKDKNKAEATTQESLEERIRQAQKKAKKNKPVAEYEKYSNTRHGWGLVTNTQHKVPQNGAESKVFAKYRSFYYRKSKEKKIYLTFDCGYENGYTNKIISTLKKEDVPATFFVTKPYIQGNARIVKRMKREGFLVGNHTCTHPSLPSKSVTEIRKEIAGCASYMKKKTGYEMDPYLRPPMGEWSNRTLKVAKDMGYSSIFWSMAFMDYDVAHQPGAAAIRQQFLDHYHKGAIVLLHAVSQSDTQALPDIIKDMKKKGYEFGSLDDIWVEKVQGRE